MIPHAVELTIGVAGIVGGGIALYVRLTFSNFIVDILDKRYPSKEVLEARLTALHESVDNLPCKSGRICRMNEE